MHTHERKTNVHIAVMDTRKLDYMPVFHATVLMEVFGLPGPEKDLKIQRKLRLENYRSEYLFYRSLRNSSNNPCYRAVRWEDICATDVHNLLRVFSKRPASNAELFLRIERHRLTLDSLVDYWPSARCSLATRAKWRAIRQ